MLYLVLTKGKVDTSKNLFASKMRISPSAANNILTCDALANPSITAA